MMYRFECSDPEKHFGYGHNCETCFHATEPDYEAALELHRNAPSPIISGAQDEDELGAIKALVEAAYPDA